MPGSDENPAANKGTGMKPRWSLTPKLTVLAALCLALSAHGSLATTLTLYSAQHEQTVDILIKAFTKETGIDVKVHSGEGPELASQLVKEGARSPA